MAIRVTPFGRYRDAEVEQFHLVSDTGVEVDIISFGGVVRDWRVPVAGGPKRSVVLGFEALEDYLEHSPHFGSIVGRVANRVRHAAFDLDGEHHALAANVAGEQIQLHGGVEGFGRQVWRGEADSAQNSVRLSLYSPDGAMGYPGGLEVSATYRLEGNALSLSFEAVPDRRTPVSLVQHQYFNLSGDETVLDHEVAIASSAYTELDESLTPTGAILPSANTRYDLRAGRTMRDGAGEPIDYDIGLVLDTGRRDDVPVAVVRAPDGGLSLKLFTDRPGVQFYNGVQLDVAVPGLNGRRYPKHAGFCLEDQMLADALNNPHFPSIIHSPDTPYRHWNRIEIG